ncbi:glycosyltransferase [Lachnoclostridium sp. An181]|uniref:glycosyltransferase n=1 Tax=Lachnoclostridium sp. An181 TaxID=1965575 RepID=UPI000B36D8BB|nr:glycosyltransferase [Lachnoclostridium sp. An181]OUP49749.1 hypothetical protein B5F18_06970 [Lachnoclostridium sp. An181]
MKQEKIKVSLIVPVYNAQEYLSETLECIVNQTLKEIEIILVDDGSKDNSGKICDEYSKKDQRIRVFHQENHGMCASRNFGISIAEGEYIAFADNDDLLDKDFLKDNYELAVKTNADLVKFGRKTIYINEKGEKRGEETRKFEKIIIDRNHIKKKYFEIQKTGALNGVWDGLYKKKMLQECGIKFHEEFRYGFEDALFCREIMPYVNKIVFNDKVYYYHYIRETYSASAKFNDSALDKYKNACELEMKVWEKLGIDREENGDKELEIANEYLVPILFMLTDKSCRYTWKRKKDYLNKLQNYEGFQFELTKEKVKKMKIKNRNQSIIIKMFQNRKYTLILYIAKVYKYLIDRKLKRGVR